MIRKPTLFIAALALTAVACAHRHEEGEDEHHGRNHDVKAQSTTNAAPSKPEALWRAECGQSCHIAFPTAMLPERSWRKLMGDLGKHFGEDASLDANTARVITDYLAANSAEQAWFGKRRRALKGLDDAQTPLRISEMPWFQREHRRHVKEADWKLPKVKSAANCGACHPDAARGDFNEHRVSIPRS